MEWEDHDSYQGVFKTVTDAKNGYRGIPLRKTNKHLTTFITLLDKFRYARAPEVLYHPAMVTIVILLLFVLISK